MTIKSLTLTALLIGAATSVNAQLLQRRARASEPVSASSVTKPTAAFSILTVVQAIEVLRTFSLTDTSRIAIPGVSLTSIYLAPSKTYHELVDYHLRNWDGFRSQSRRDFTFVRTSLKAIAGTEFSAAINRDFNTNRLPSFAVVK